MSLAAHKKWASKLGQELKERLSRLTAMKIISGQQKKGHRGYFFSVKMNDYVAWYSTYELRALTILENDPKVLNYKTAYYYEINSRSRVADIFVNNNKIIEVKPKDIIDKKYPKVIEQIEDAKKYCHEQKIDYEIWSENELGFASYHECRVWSDNFRKNLTGIDYPSIRKQKARDRANRHYWSKVAGKTVTNYCEYCKCYHTQLKVTFLNNLKKNKGQFICIHENGRIIGNRPKDHLKKDNPYASDGKKQCNECKEIKEFGEFSPDKTKRDGYSTRCKICRAAKYKAKYQKKRECDSNSSIESEDNK